jgi:competence protein ComEA
MKQPPSPPFDAFDPRRRGLLLALCLPAFAAQAQAGAALEVNEASQAELEMIKGIGPALSEAILAERRQRHFQDWADFTARMAGIGPARASKLSAAGLMVSGQPWPHPAPAPGFRP